MRQDIGNPLVLKRCLSSGTTGSSEGAALMDRVSIATVPLCTTLYLRRSIIRVRTLNEYGEDLQPITHCCWRSFRKTSVSAITDNVSGQRHWGAVRSLSFFNWTTRPIGAGSVFLDFERAAHQSLSLLNDATPGPMANRSRRALTAMPLKYRNIDPIRTVCRCTLAGGLFSGPFHVGAL